MSDAAAAIPPGFAPLPVGGGFIAINGPLYLLREGAVVKFGFRVEPRHCNPMGICHGGMLASFCDMLLPVSVHHKSAPRPTTYVVRPPWGLSSPAEPDLLKSAEVGRRFLPTVSLQLDYMAPVPLGAWVEGQADVLKVTRAMVFAQGVVHADGVLAVRCSGVFKIGPKFGDDAR